LRSLRCITQLVLKELISLWRDRVLLLFMLYAFSIGIYTQAHGITHELRNAAIAVIDGDNSPLSQAVRDGFLPPQFRPPQAILPRDVNKALDNARFTFVLDIPPNFQADVQAGHRPSLQLLIDATAIMQAGLGANTIQAIVNQEINRFVHGEKIDDKKVADKNLIELQLRAAFNQGLESLWFTGTMEMLNNITMLAILLAGAALIREREHGTLEHLLVLPVQPIEIMLGKVLANGLVIMVLTLTSLLVILKGVLGMQIAGSIPLFLSGVAAYLFFASSLGIFLGTIARSMPQLGLLFILVVLPMILLSGGTTPMESMPAWLRSFMQYTPSAQFVAFAQAILYRGLGFEGVWLRLLGIAGVGAVFFAIAALRFRSFLSKQQ